MTKRHFLIMAEDLTGTPRDEIQVINYSTDENGLMSGTIEIDGNREFIHEYSC